MNVKIIEILSKPYAVEHKAAYPTYFTDVRNNEITITSKFMNIYYAAKAIIYDNGVNEQILFFNSTLMFTVDPNDSRLKNVFEYVDEKILIVFDSVNNWQDELEKHNKFDNIEFWIADKRFRNGS